RQIEKAGGRAADKCIAGVFALKKNGKMKTIRQNRRHIFGGMDGEIDSAVCQRLFDLLGKKPLAADLGKRAVLTAVARRRHGNDFDGFFRKTMRLHQAATRLVSLGESKLAAPRAYLQRAI